MTRVSGAHIIRMAGGMGERLKPAVLKTVCGATRTGVRIPLPPPYIFEGPQVNARHPSKYEQIPGFEPTASGLPQRHIRHGGDAIWEPPRHRAPGGPLAIR